MTTRRELLYALGLCAVAPLRALAQGGKPRRIGFLWERPQADAAYVQRLNAFKAGLSALGYAEGTDYVLEHRSAYSNPASLPAAAAELVALKVDLIVTSGPPSATAAAKATREVPILIVAVADPVGTGLAATLASPGGNVTGFTTITSDLIAKRLDLLREILPGLARVAYLYDPDS